MCLMDISNTGSLTKQKVTDMSLLQGSINFGPLSECAGMAQVYLEEIFCLWGIYLGGTSLPQAYQHGFITKIHVAKINFSSAF